MLGHSFVEREERAIMLAKQHPDDEAGNVDVAEDSDPDGGSPRGRTLIETMDPREKVAM